jgi:hypothetical protein
MGEVVEVGQEEAKKGSTQKELTKGISLHVQMHSLGR